MAEEKQGMQEVTPDQLSAVLGGANINEVAAQSAQQTEEATEEKPEESQGQEQETTETEEPKVETQGEPAGEGQETTEPEPQAFDIEFFNKQFSTDFSDEDGIKEALKAIQEIEALKEQVGTIDSMKEELDLLRQEADPMKYFASEDDYKVAQFKKTFPDKDPAVVARLFSTDLSQVNDFDVLTWMTMLDNPNLDGGEAGARELVADIYGVDDPSNLSELDSLTKNKLRVSAGKERDRLKDMKKGIDLPEKKDYSSLMEQRKAEQAEKREKLEADWKSLTSEVVKNYPDVVITDTDKDGNETEFFRYQVGKDMNEAVVQPVVEGFIKAGIPIDEQSAKALGVALQKEFIFQNRDKIVKQAVKNALATQEEKTLQEEHNPGTPNTKERPKSGAKDVTAKILEGLRSGSTQPKRAF